MTEYKSILVDYKHLLECLITFGDVVTIRVLGRGTLNIDGFLRFKNISHVDGLKANLVSISQICELNHNVNFNHEKYASVFWKVFVHRIIFTHSFHLHTHVTK